MTKTTYIQGGKELIYEIRPLWEALNTHHKNSAIHFSDKMHSNTFEKRHEKFIDDTIEVYVELVKVEGQEKPVGYSISTISNDGMGEIDSLYVEEAYRKLAIGEALMNNALKWLRNNDTKLNRIKVAEGNEAVLKFYKKFGFETRFYVLEEVSSRKIN